MSYFTAIEMGQITATMPASFSEFSLKFCLEVIHTHYLLGTRTSSSALSAKREVLSMQRNLQAYGAVRTGTSALPAFT